ncbi:MAG TPA: hypothetical protein DDW76_12390 [Cyanobacteria bacterium UBA11369]|nr:hypothetical protein [Cyanobacteria bacterium UBA11371]HBE33341.1 hypothetical protein [Cyanobacteria bacterium UBA11368]HBE49564.1 hypothetical protein [Cyanobacteria bacterium UBA11369]
MQLASLQLARPNFITRIIVPNWQPAFDFLRYSFENGLLARAIAAESSQVGRLFFTRYRRMQCP